ncbi:hypothetical protein H4R18_002436 [Coemansia javaensis]|uniref:UBR-type domain-containing protein n=1 Tax=Coemansia javaensis TaxID=2761396 RepID=A0A9W8LK15_9FUNG|nr:hypothetical protein H4R18_002436 [Coemansia javaensis]
MAGDSGDDARAAAGSGSPAAAGDAGADDGGGEAVLTACSYLDMQAELEREASEVLPGKFDECTFGMGYIRQPLYACLTCTRPPAQYRRQGAASGGDPTDPAGMCYSCSIECHTDHEVVELFTKRRFRCDCGTRRLLPARKAAADPACCLLKRAQAAALAETENRDNAYGHNFWGFYCRCDRFYDPASETGLMVQCYVCNDWYHDACIGAMPSEERCDDYICRECVAKHAVLRYIRSPAMVRGVVVDGRVASLEDPLEDSPEDPLDGSLENQPASSSSEPCAEDGGGEPATKRPRPSACRLRRDTDAIDAGQPFDLFMGDGWRKDVCTCLDCMRGIAAGGLLFLLNEEDVVEPEEDEARGESLYESALKRLRAMDHVQAVDAAAAYRSLSAKIKDYLRPFAASGRVVTGQDIRAFFEQHAARRDA